MRERQRECITLADKRRAKREISPLGHGCEERERKNGKESGRQGEKCRVCHGMMVGFFGFFCCSCFIFLSLHEASGAPTLSFASCLFAGRLACAQDHAFPQLPQHAAHSCTHLPV
jgi:hypothetical protein